LRARERERERGRERGRGRERERWTREKGDARDGGMVVTYTLHRCQLTVTTLTGREQWTLARVYI